MAENNVITSKRDAHLERMRAKYPDKKFEDDEEIYGQISDDYDQYEQSIQELEGYKINEKAISDMLSADPRSAQFLADMHNGKDPILSLVNQFGLHIKDILDDPEMQEAIAEENKQYVERVAKSKALDEEYEKNLETSLETLRQFQEERGMSDEQIDEVGAFAINMINDGVMGKFSRETLEMIVKALNYDGDVDSAIKEGRVAGRNDKIVESLRKAKEGDGTSPLQGKNSHGAPQHKKQSIFDLAHEAL